VANEKEITLEYFNFRYNEVQQFQANEQLPEDGHVWLNHEAVDFNLNIISC
jgi:hypothetical protein